MMQHKAHKRQGTEGAYELFRQGEYIHRRSSMRGFSLVTAVFLLVVISALGAFAVTVSRSQQQSDVMDILGARAYQAAKTGIEWSIYQITNGATCATLAQPAMPAGTQLSAFAVAVVCNATQYTEGANTFLVYQLTSTARTGVVGSFGYLERQLQVTISN